MHGDGDRHTPPSREVKASEFLRTSASTYRPCLSSKPSTPELTAAPAPQGPAPPALPQTEQAPSQEMEPALVKKKVMSVLNKISDQTYSHLIGDILQLMGNINTVETLNEVAACIHKQSITAQVHWSLYASICAALHERERRQLADGHDKSESGTVKCVAFRRALLNACQTFFENPPTLPENFAELPVIEQEEQETKLKEQKVGNIRLIAELYKKGLMSEALMHIVIKTLLFSPARRKEHRPTFVDILMLSTIMESVGPSLNGPKMDGYFKTMAKWLNTAEPKIRYRVQGLIELRAAGWVKAERKPILAPKQPEHAMAQAA